MLGAKTCRFGFRVTALLCVATCCGVLSAQTPGYRVGSEIVLQVSHPLRRHPPDFCLSTSRIVQNSRSYAQRPYQCATAECCESCRFIGWACVWSA